MARPQLIDLMQLFEACRTEAERHAIFDYHKIPLLGREEDAADQLAAYVLLNLETEDAVRLIKAAV